jgi:hypothetical protein
MPFEGQGWSRCAANLSKMWPCLLVSSQSPMTSSWGLMDATMMKFALPSEGRILPLPYPPREALSGVLRACLVKRMMTPRPTSSCWHRLHLQNVWLAASQMRSSGSPIPMSFLATDGPKLHKMPKFLKTF